MRPSNPMFLDDKPIVILGMQRSGTSAVAGALTRLGVNMGPDDGFFPEDSNNSAGYFELRALTTFSHKCLTFFQMSVASTQPLPEAWTNYPQARILIDELKALLKNHFSESPLWGFKQPIASIIWPIYAQALIELDLNPSFVICVRNPMEVMSSEANWVYAPGGRQLAPFGAKAIGVWMNYTFSALDAAKHADLTVVPYKDFISNPRHFLERIVNKSTAWKPSESAWETAVQSVNPALKHHQNGVDSLTNAPVLARKLLEYCEAKPEDSEALDNLTREWSVWQSMLAPQKLSGTRIGLAWRARGQIDSVQIPFLPSGDWQVIRFEFDAPPSTLMNGVLYNKACRIWIRRAEFLTPNGPTIAKLMAGPGSQINEINGIIRLDGAYETQQVNLVTPSQPGPYHLEWEILLEAGQQISQDTAARLADRLHQCAARTTQVMRQRGQNR